MRVHKEEMKYRIFWLIGAGLCAILYFSGIFWTYEFFRKRILKRYRTIVLTYHRIRDDGKDSDISVSTKNFKKQMQYLTKNFNVISLNTLLNNIENRADIPVDNVAITFDDGFKDNYLNAYPILKRYKLPATIFLISQLAGVREDMLDSDEIKIMKNDNIDFGSHTATHQTLSDTDIETATQEIFNSKVEIENMLDEEIHFFAYPKGKRKHFDNQIKQQVEASGYKAAFATENGEITSDCDLFELKRIGMRNFPFFVFQLRVSGLFESRLVFFIRSLLRLT
jgi:peptidoglycan/xylan/chitin deacetylase (PgdA/CDA1 family)